MVKTKKEEAADRNQAMDDGMLPPTSAPRRPPVAPAKEEVPPFLNFAPLDNAQAALDRSAERYSRAIKAFTAAKAGATPQAFKSLNDKLIQTERRLTNTGGLPRPPWVPHLISAPRFSTRYRA